MTLFILEFEFKCEYSWARINNLPVSRQIYVLLWLWTNTRAGLRERRSFRLVSEDKHHLESVSPAVLSAHCFCCPINCLKTCIYGKYAQLGVNVLSLSG